MADHLDVPLEDAALLEEVELISAVMIGASEEDEHLDQEQIDKLLGVQPPKARADDGDEGRRTA